MMGPEDWQFVAFTAGMAVLSTVLVVPTGLLMAWLLARPKWPGKAVVETLTSLPLVLPPVVTGLLLLRLFGRRGPFGQMLHDSFGMDVVFTWRAVVIALAVMSFPLFVRSARAAIEGVDTKFEQLGRSLGAGEWRVFFTITLPIAKRGVIAGTLLAFARALGEFGATMLVAGNIAGETTTMSVAIYHYILIGDDGRAWQLAGISAVLAFIAVLMSYMVIRRR